MPDLTATNVSTGKGKLTGYLYYAPTSTTAPTDATTTLASAFKSLGYVSDDGVTNAFSRESEDIKDWNGTPVLAAQTDVTDTWQLTLIEAKNPEVLKAVFGTSAVVMSSTTLKGLKVDAAEAGNFMFVIEMVMSGNSKKRVVIPNGKISEVGDIVYAPGEPIGYEITITCMPDSSNKLHYEYFA